MRHNLRSALFAAALVVLVAVAAGAYTTYGKWTQSSILVYANPTSPDVGAAAIETALRSSMQTWNSAGIKVQLSYAGRSSDTTASFNGRSVVMFRNTNGGSTIASTYAWSTNGSLVEADTIFWDGSRRFFTGTSGCTSSAGAYIEDIATHEFGHTLGLNHSSDVEATMYAGYKACSTTKRTLASDDLNGIRSLYTTLPVKDTPPTLTLVSPLNGASYSVGVAIPFSATAIDVPDGTISSKINWSSNLSGNLGTGASLSKALPAGTHTITAKVTDSIGYTIARAIIVYVR